MTDRSMPNSAQEWADFLAKKSLPSPFRVGEFAVRKLSKETLSYPQLANIINRDPILSLGILSRVNQEAEASDSIDNDGSKTLAHAISMLGIEELKASIEKLPKKAISPKNITSFYYLRTLCTSLYAGYLARAISIKKKKGNAEDVYWSSLFLGAPIWYLWRFATPEMRLVRYAIRSNFKLPKIAEAEVFGDNLNEVTRVLSKTLALPKMAQECYLTENQPSLSDWVKIAHCADPDRGIQRIEDRDLKIKMQKPHFIVMLANLLAHYSSYCWYSRATLRAQRILATYLDCSLEDAIRFSHEVAADMSQHHPLPGLMLPAAKLFVPPRKRTKAKKQKSIDAFQESTFDTSVLPKTISAATESDVQAKPSAQPSTPNLEDNRQLESQKTPEQTKPSQTQATSAKPAEQSEKTHDSALFDELTHLMAQQPEEFSDFHELMNAATQGIAYGINLSRSFVALISKDHSRLKTYYNVGCSKYKEVKNFESRIIQDTIFEKLCERPASVWVKPSSEKKIKDLMPMNFTTAIEVNEFLLMSVFVGKKPVAIFYADNVDNSTITPRQYHQFKFLCGAVSSALQYQAKASRQAAEKKAP
ncbi:MAG: HDOD domain-containing protein [Oleiphilus sp.]